MAEEEQQTSGVFEFNAPELKCETVIVYLDRAEVSRSLRVEVKAGGNEVIIKELSASIDKDSIRVEGRGACTISEVAFQSKSVSAAEKSEVTEKGKQLKEKLREVEAKLKQLKDKQHRLEKQRKVLDEYADNITKMPEGNTQATGAIFLQNFSQMSDFFGLYEGQASRLDKELQDVKEEIYIVDAEQTALKENLRRCEVVPRREARELSVLLDAEKAGEVELTITYVLSQAKWSPKYDIRVFSNENKLMIHYFGMVQQATGEEWNDAKLCLSTAQPSIGGTVPDLGTQKLAFKPKYRQARMRMMAAAPMRKMKNLSMQLERSNYNISMDNCEDEEDDDRPDMVHLSAQVKESIATTLYEISRRTTIPSDNTGHKVTVALIDLVPAMEYESVPRRAQHVYLKARVKNTSQYALLAGPTNVFLDNNFIAKAELKAVSPLEEFTCSLGVDPSVRVTYHPLNKFREQLGIITKSTSTVYKQVIEIKNTHKDSVRVLVMDQLPLSTEEKIKVTLNEPSIKHPEKYDPSKPIRLNKVNNIEWDLEIAPNESKELILRYTVDHPVSETIETTTQHYNLPRSDSSDV